MHDVTSCVNFKSSVVFEHSLHLQVPQKFFVAMHLAFSMKGIGGTTLGLRPVRIGLSDGTEFERAMFCETPYNMLPIFCDTAPASSGVFSIDIGIDKELLLSGSWQLQVRFLHRRNLESGLANGSTIFSSCFVSICPR